jgi:hypothetical protein
MSAPDLLGINDKLHSGAAADAFARSLERWKAGQGATDEELNALAALMSIDPELAPVAPVVARASREKNEKKRASMLKMAAVAARLC